jgi:predicted transcriptional regulator
MQETAENVRAKLLKEFPNTTFTNRYDFVNPEHARKAQIEYNKAKISFRHAAKDRKKESWANAKEKYEYFITKIYPLDHDALSEYSVICSHLAFYYRGEEQMRLFDESIKFRDYLRRLQKNNFFHKIKLGEIYRKRKQTEKSINEYKELMGDENDDLETKIEFIINLIILFTEKCDQIKNNKKNKNDFDEHFKVLRKYYQMLKKIQTDSIEKIPKSFDSVIMKIEKNIERLKQGNDIEMQSLVIQKDRHVDVLDEEYRMGVMLYLLKKEKYVLETKIKNEWLVNTELTKKILNELVKNNWITKIELDTTNAYQITKEGIEEAQIFISMVSGFIEKNTSPVEPSLGFTNHLLNKLQDWGIDGEFCTQYLSKIK